MNRTRPKQIVIRVSEEELAQIKDNKMIKQLYNLLSFMEMEW